MLAEMAERSGGDCQRRGIGSNEGYVMARCCDAPAETVRRILELGKSNRIIIRIAALDPGYGSVGLKPFLHFYRYGGLRSEYINRSLAGALLQRLGCGIRNLVLAYIQQRLGHMCDPVHRRQRVFRAV
ncbi:hypothetical protein D3C73_1102470 [compost metagenome]